MIGVTCKYCGSDNTRVLYPLENKEEYTIVKCLACEREYPYDEK